MYTAENKRRTSESRGKNNRCTTYAKMQSHTGVCC